MANIGTVYNTIGKQIYDTGVTDQMIKSAPYVKKRYKKPLDLGIQANFAILQGWSEGFGSRGPNEALPVPQAPNYLAPYFDAVDMYNVLRIGGKEDIRTKSQVRAMVTYMSDLLRQSADNFWRAMEIYAFGDGTGLLALTSGVVPSNGATAVTFAVTSAYVPLVNLRVNMAIEFWNDATGVMIESTLIASCDRIAGTFTAVVQNDIPDGTSVYNKGDRNRVIAGLSGMISDSTGPATFEGIASTLPEWRATLLSNGGNSRNLTQGLLDQSYFIPGEQDGKEPSEYWMAYAQIRAWLAMVQRNFQINSNGPSVKINNHNEIEGFGKASVNVSSGCQSDRIFSLYGQDIEIRELQKYGPILEEKASNMWMKLPGLHTFEATMWWSGQHTLKRRNLHVQINNLASPS